MPSNRARRKSHSPAPPKQSFEIQTLWFDLGNVILPFDFAPAYRRLARYNHSCAPEDIRDFVRRHPTLEADCDNGTLHAAALYRMLRHKFAFHALTYAGFKKIWNDIFSQNREVIRLIGHLRKRGYRLILISNTNKLHYDHIWARYPVMRLFHTRVLSYKVRSRKPEPRIYHTALRASLGKPRQIFYTDDKDDLIQSARRQLGVQTHTFVHYAGLKNALHHLGVSTPV